MKNEEFEIDNKRFRRIIEDFLDDARKEKSKKEIILHGEFEEILSKKIKRIIIETNSYKVN